MKSVQTLLRVKQRELDVLKRQQAIIETQREEVKGRIDRLAQQLLDEIQSAESMPEMAHFFSNFSLSIKTRQDQLQVHLRKLDIELDKLAVQLLDRLGELKKYELALANFKKRRDEVAARRAQQYMDEIAIRGYIRREE